MFSLGIWELIIIGVALLLVLGTIGGVVAAVMFASSSRGRERH